MYLIYLLVWLSIILILNILYRVLPKKMKETENQQTKNTLFTILLFTSIPLILIAFIAPILILAGDKAMPGDYKIYFVVIAAVSIIASFTIKKKSS
ncbi:MAG: hypothetical protein EHM58_10765 [Ignavibacteriae bacterium]|nr:MAG: hypothetical protein EHM58_10765 [Ignavibacteriota bacterium]